ncbi:glycosyltransferase family 2 protein [Amaricoccus tamworthensis]|uniref:glycosyltransferase family 2 protein n=1 Tax=Amaricoccus tamworthensis TaxID=57002 RepID=UPI003C7D1E12
MDTPSGNHGGGDGPLVSVIVPVYRQWHLVPLLLDGLRRQTFDAVRFEILLIDNEPGARRPQVDLPHNARILECAAPGAYASRNVGIGAARGQLLAFTDADCRPKPQWLAALVGAWEQAGDGMFAGPVDLVCDSERPNRYEVYDLFRGIPQARYVRNGYAATANLMMPKALVERLGGFDVTRMSGGDSDLTLRATRSGISLSLVEDAVVEHPTRDDWEAAATKARRVKGGQLTAGPYSRRLKWFLRTLTPPVRAMVRYLRMDRPWRQKGQAILVLYQLWFVELWEMGRLLLGGSPERK